MRNVAHFLKAIDCSYYVWPYYIPVILNEIEIIPVWAWAFRTTALFNCLQNFLFSNNLIYQFIFSSRNISKVYNIHVKLLFRLCCEPCFKIPFYFFFQLNWVFTPLTTNFQSFNFII